MYRVQDIEVNKTGLTPDGLMNTPLVVETHELVWKTRDRWVYT